MKLSILSIFIALITSVAICTGAYFYHIHKDHATPEAKNVTSLSPADSFYEIQNKIKESEFDVRISNDKYQDIMLLNWKYKVEKSSDLTTPYVAMITAETANFYTVGEDGNKSGIGVNFVATYYYIKDKWTRISIEDSPTKKLEKEEMPPYAVTMQYAEDLFGIIK